MKESPIDNPTIPWTIATVKEHLPRVNVKIVATGEVYTGRVTGRMNLLATITVVQEGLSPSSNTVIWKDGHYSWEAVMRSANSGEPLLM